jgi:D-alanyl-D-alanine carboxypeptidase
MKGVLIVLPAIAIAVLSVPSDGGSLQANADSIRTAFGIPEMGYAVVSADSILEVRTFGIKRADSSIPAEPGDRFHLGSCTKAITGFIAGLMVSRGQIDWETRFFDLCPELEAASNAAYSDITLVDLSSHRAWLQPLTEDEEFPEIGKFHGAVAEQRFQFVAWALTLEPVETEEAISYSNAGYSAAALMLERASGKTWEELVGDLGHELDLDFGLSWPNASDPKQPWGHTQGDSGLVPTPPTDEYDLHWVEPAGDINMSVLDYAKFLQMQLRGLRGDGPLLSREEYEFLHSGMPDHYSIGWAWGENDQGHLVSAHSGSADTFWCYARVIKDIDRAYAVFANCGSEDCDAGVRKLLVRLMKEYGR